jgi:hypothetical protein
MFQLSHFVSGCFSFGALTGLPAHTPIGVDSETTRRHVRLAWRYSDQALSIPNISKYYATCARYSAEWDATAAFCRRPEPPS